jgi:hypothetical protein
MSLLIQACSTPQWPQSEYGTRSVPSQVLDIANDHLQNKQRTPQIPRDGHLKFGRKEA